MKPDLTAVQLPPTALKIYLFVYPNINGLYTVEKTLNPSRLAV